MRLKEIKPGMVIHCKTLEEMKELSKHIHIPFNVDGVWRHGSDCINFEPENITTHCNLNYFVKKNYEITEFSDLIIPEITAEEVIEWFRDYFISDEFIELFGEDYSMSGLTSTFSPSEIVSKIAQWKSGHEKKEPEIEWVYRVFGAENYGEKFFHTEEEAIKRCEELAMSQKTKQYARYERVCREKAVE